MRKEPFLHDEQGPSDEEFWEERLSVPIYFMGENGGVLYEDCTQPLCHLKIEEDWFPIFCTCGHIFIVPIAGNTICNHCKKRNAIPDFEVMRQE